MPSLHTSQCPDRAGAGAVFACLLFGLFLYSIEGGSAFLDSLLTVWKQLNQVYFSCLQLVAQNLNS